jgi:hypothetical protein
LCYDILILTIWWSIEGNGRGAREVAESVGKWEGLTAGEELADGREDGGETTTSSSDTLRCSAFMLVPGG